MVKFGERLKAARTAKHMSQQALADVIGKNLNPSDFMSAASGSRVWKRYVCLRIRWRFPVIICWREPKQKRWPRSRKLPMKIWSCAF